MNKKLVISTLLMVGILNASDSYGSLGIAQTSVDGLDDGISVVGTFGKKMGNDSALELEVTQTISHPSESYSSYYYSYDLELNILNIGIYAVYDFLIPDTKVTIKPRIGLNYQHWTVEGSDDWGSSASASDSETDLSYGIGVSYQFGNGKKFLLDYTDKGDSENLSMNVQMAF